MSYWATVKSFALLFGPVLLPRVIAYYKSQRTAATTHGLSPQSLPPAVHNSLILLLSLTTFFLLHAFLRPPENIFLQTSSRLQIPADVLFNRFSSLIRPLTPTDEVLRARFVSLESRLLYLKYGPQVLADCSFCTSERPMVYFAYALPSLLIPHLFNIFAIALVTSPLLAGQWVLRWRSPAVVASAIFAIVDLYSVYSYPHKANAVALRLGELDMFHWRAFTLRYVGLAILNVIVAALMYLTATNRAFVQPPIPAMRVEAANKNLAAVLAKLNAVSILRNTVVRNRGLREHANTYWGSEAQVTQELMLEDEVKESVKDAVENNRIDVVSVTKSAQQYAATILGPWLAQAEAKAKSSGQTEANKSE